MSLLQLAKVAVFLHVLIVCRYDDGVFGQTDGRLVTRHRLVGLLLISTQTALRTGRTLATIRRPSGTAQRLLGTAQRLLGTGQATVTMEAGETDFIAVVDDLSLIHI